MRLRAVYCNNKPSPYSVERTNLLVEGGNIDVEAWFAGGREADRSWRVDEDEWGFPSRLGDPRALADRMDVLARDAALRARMGKKAAELASAGDHVRYAEEFERFVEKTLSFPERRNPVALAARTVGWGLMKASRREPTSYVGGYA